jgi:hypothetical protein
LVKAFLGEAEVRETGGEAPACRFDHGGHHRLRPARQFVRDEIAAREFGYKNIVLYGLERVAV